MNFNWNIDKIENLLSSKENEIKIIHDNDYHNLLAFDINSLYVVANQIKPTKANINNFTDSGFKYYNDLQTINDSYILDNNFLKKLRKKTSLTNVSPYKAQIKTLIDEEHTYHLVRENIKKYSKHDSDEFYDFVNRHYIYLSNKKLKP